MNNYNETELDINEIFNKVISSTYGPSPPNTYPLQFELDSLKDLFEFLLEFVTMLCKAFYSNNNGQVNLGGMTPEQFNIINEYMQSIGFTCEFKAVPANSDNINYIYENRYDRITFTSETKLKDLLFSIKCVDILYIIKFDKI